MGVVYELDRYGGGVLPEDGADQARRAHPAMAPMMMPPSFNLLTS
jgi:hypothetical protein